ncbi:MAG: GIY-YIG nuclease family protein [Bacteroidetes bacterium]|nr:GIY-YIG nuclease family protein [Bacteroidota bacterium]
MQHFCYILFSSSLDRFYVGSTSDSVENRLKKHLSNHCGFTAKAKDWKIVWVETFSNKSDALKRESFIKKMKSKISIKKLIESSEHPDL